MKLNRLAHHYVTLGVFLMLTVAVVASQARATRTRLLPEVEPVMQDVAGQVLVNVARQLDDGARINALQGHD